MSAPQHTFDGNIDEIVTSLPAPVEDKVYFLVSDNRLYFAGSDSYQACKVPLWSQVTIRNTGEVYRFTGNALEPSVLVKSVSGKVGNVILTQSDVGLSNIDNTSDEEKPVSLLQRIAIDTKVSSQDTNVVVANLEALKAVDTFRYKWCYRQGFSSPQDGGDSFWIFDALSELLPNDINIVRPDEGDGRWLLNGTSEINVKICGIGSGSDDSTKIQSIVDLLPIGGTIAFPAGNYIFSGVNITKPISIKGSSQFDGGVVFTNPTVSQPFFSCTNTHAILMSGFKMTSSAIRTSSAYLYFSNVNRVKLTDFFADKYFIGIDFDGGSEIIIDSFQMFDGVPGTINPGSGAIRLGNNSYTGSVSIDNAYIKCSDNSKQCSFGIQAKYVDVLNIGPGTTIIQHGTNLLINPSNSQTTSLVKSFGACYDTAINGLYVTPDAGAKVTRCDFFGCWFGEHSNSGVTIDGSLGTIDGMNITGGELINCTYSGINILGSLAKNIKLSYTDVAGNGIGVRLANNANVSLRSNTIGSVALAGGNTSGLSLDPSVSGECIGNEFTQNTAGISGSIGTDLSFFQNKGVTNWVHSIKIMSATNLSLGANSGTLTEIREQDKVIFKYTNTITTNGSAFGGLIIPLSYPVIGGFVGCGRGVTTGKQLQAYANGGSSCVVYNYDGTYAGGDNTVIEISGTYQTNP